MKKIQIFVLLICLLLFKTNTYADKVYIAVASNFIEPMRQLVQMFEETVGHQAITSIGSTRQLYAQIKNDAPFEVFLAADIEHPQLLVKEGNAIAESFFIYAVGQLVLWSPQTDLVETEAKVLNTAQFRHLAMANPKTAPYGTATQQVLTKLGLWESLQQKIVQGNNVGQTYQFVVTGNAELGFIAYSQYQTTPIKGSHWLVPQKLYEPLRQGAVLLKKGVNNPAALAFIKFLQSDLAQQRIITFGYGIFSPPSTD